MVVYELGEVVIAPSFPGSRVRSASCSVVLPGASAMGIKHE